VAVFGHKEPEKMVTGRKEISMKIAVTAMGKSLYANLDLRFGRAQYILILDPDGTILEVIDNAKSRAAMGGAGIHTAKMVADRKVDVLLTGRCGPNAHAALKAASIKIGEVLAGTVREVLGRFNRGEIALS
jgi:predicted Fe-Mo cluster-binding NifX family protein